MTNGYLTYGGKSRPRRTTAAKAPAKRTFNSYLPSWIASLRSKKSGGRRWSRKSNRSRGGAKKHRSRRYHF